MLDLNSPEMYDKVYGCWMGKNVGGTLGGPLEKGYGEEEPFDVWWYPKLQEGGIPNDDLEMQLIWLKCLEEHGPQMNSHDLCEYWLNHINYNWDEYGWARMNMRLGLVPPVAGNYNNYFIDCMGCPIRSELFACVAPGLPRLAVRYAYEDAITDHAGGESVYGEMFNTAMESAAFIVSDLHELLDIGRSYVKDGSLTAKAIDAARSAKKAGLDWKAARRKVLEATPHYNAQYSPINMGFQTVGLLYGKDFAEAICIAVNCGYDTDCTGATVGSILGILLGAKGLPAKWTDPLGDTIATSASWGSLLAVDKGPNPIPLDLQDLTKRTIRQAILCSAGHTPSRDTLYADDSTRKLWTASPTRVDFPVGSFKVGVEYHDSPAVAANSTKSLQTALVNDASVPLTATCTILTLPGWEAIAPQEIEMPANGEATLDWSIKVPGPKVLNNSNRLSLRVDSPKRIAQQDAPIVLIGARRQRFSKPYTVAGADKAALLEHAFEPETLVGDNANVATARNGLDTIHASLGHDLSLVKVLPPSHAMYVQAFYYSDVEREVILGVPTTGSVKTWVNGVLLHNLVDVERFRPHLHLTQAYMKVMMKPGYNEVLAKFVRHADTKTFDAHLILCDPADRNAGIIDLPWTRFPWD
ncbi:hypothetical protein BH10PLA1_BH10PLA1_10340 [soil metagenome]